MSRLAARKFFGKPNPRFVVDIVPVLKDNFSYIITDLATKAAAAVDVADASAIVAAVNALPTGAPSSLCVLTTHKHWDHAGGNVKLAAEIPNLSIYGGVHDKVPGCTHPLQHEATLTIGELQVTTFHTPCHTSGHVLYHVVHPEAPEDGALFTGDTLFVGGIGAFFEGTAQNMIDALALVADRVPHSTSIFPGHEYTVNFLKFTNTVYQSAVVAGSQPEAAAFAATQLEKYQALRAEGQPTVPSTIEEEIIQNPFVRAVVNAEFRKSVVGKEDVVEAMQKLYDTCP